MLGSVGELLLAGTRAAVVVAPKGFASGAPSAIKSVTAGFNRAPEGHAALRTAAALAADFREAACSRGRGRRSCGRDTPSTHVHDGPSLEEELDRALADVQAPDAERILLSGEPARCLAQACSDADLMVVGPRSYGPLHHTLLGSVSAKLMRSCPAPLMVVPRGATSRRAHGRDRRRATTGAS